MIHHCACCTEQPTVATDDVFEFATRAAFFVLLYIPTAGVQH